MADATPVPVLPPAEAISFFRNKGIVFGFSWLDVWQDEHARAFTVAKAMSRDVLETIRAAVDVAIADGTTLEDFQKDLRPKLEAAGWWGKKKMVDPLTAEAKTVQLGSPRRLQTIFDANVRTAYQAGKWERFERQKRAMPYLEYVAIEDSHVRPQHAAWGGTIKPIDDPWWDTHYGPCDWGCRCTARALTQRMLDRRGKGVTETPAEFPKKEWRNKRTGEVHLIEEGIGPGWSYNVGKAALAAQAPPPLPGTFDGADIADARAAAAPIAAFFAAFGIEAADAVRGKVVVDRGGWPLAISLAWFQQAGRLVLPAPARRAQLGAVGRAIADPIDIRWVWIAARDGSAMLMRRYVGNGAIVDVGKQGWRFVLAGEADLDALARDGAPGRVTEVAVAIAAYDPHQRRDGNGRWASRHAPAAAFVGAATSGAPDVPSAHRIGPIGAKVRQRLDELGIVGKAKSVALDRDLVRHIVKRHGKDGRGQRAIGADDIARSHAILHAGKINHGNPQKAPNGARRIFASAEIGGDRYTAAFEVRKYHVVLASLRKR